MIRAAEEITLVCNVAIDRANDPRNIGKGPWSTNRGHLFWLLLLEVWELGWALLALWRAERQYHRNCNAGSGTKDRELYWKRGTELYRGVEKARQHVRHEAGDCVAFLAFILDRL